jgi:hypothetical protein
VYFDTARYAKVDGKCSRPCYAGVTWRPEVARSGYETRKEGKEKVVCLKIISCLAVVGLKVERLGVHVAGAWKQGFGCVLLNVMQNGQAKC